MNRSARFVVELSGGKRVPFSLKARTGEPFYFVVFRGPDGRRLEKSTKESSQKRAETSALQVIKEEYAPKPLFDILTWDDAIASMTREMKAQNLRQRTIGDYLLMLNTLRKVLPSNRGPLDITPAHAQLFKTKRMEAGHSPYTVRGNITKLSVIWSKWLIEYCKLPAKNPWEEIEKPKVDEPEPRYIEPEEEQAFFDWLNRRWDGWRLPVLFFKVTGVVGRRILQMCSLPSTCLVDGRIVFPSEFNKSRKSEYARLSEPIFKELEALAGPTYLWERYSEQLNAIYRGRGQRKYAQCQGFRPERLKRWLQNEITAYNQENEGKPGFVPFTAHNFRDTAMTRAWDADIDLDRAAIAFGCNRETMKKHYIRKEALVIADAVYERIHGKADNGEAMPPANGVAGTDMEKKDSEKPVR